MSDYRGIVDYSERGFTLQKCHCYVALHESSPMTLYFVVLGLCINQKYLVLGVLMDIIPNTTSTINSQCGKIGNMGDEKVSTEEGYQTIREPYQSCTC